MRPNPWPLLRLLARRHAVADADPLPDAALLRRFAETRDAAAFEVLVWRHGAMVSAACRRVLRDDHAAEDAFQATFLVLARKAGTVRAAGSAAGWLHRTARRVAVRAAKRRTARQHRETPLAADPPARPEPDGDWKAALDAAVDRLPARYRLPVVLCYLDGRTTEDAARLLGVPRGTVLSRLATARQKLADHLKRGGITAPAVGLAAAGLTSDVLTAEAVGACAVEAVRFATFDSTASGPTILLAESVMRTAKFKLVALAAMSLAMAAGLGAGVTVVAAPRPAELPQPLADGQKPTAPLKADPPAVSARPDPAVEWAKQKLLLEVELERITVEIFKAHSLTEALNSQTGGRAAREELDDLYAELRTMRLKRRAIEVEYDALVARLEGLPDVKRLRTEREAAQESANRKAREKGAKSDDAGLLEMKKRVEELDRQLIDARLKAFATPGLLPPLPPSVAARTSFDLIARTPEFGAAFLKTDENRLRAKIVQYEGEFRPGRRDADLELLQEFRRRLERELFVRQLQANGITLTDQPSDRSEVESLRREVEALRAEVRALKDAKK